MGRTYAGVLGPMAFLIVLARSLLDGGAATSTLQLATGCLFGFAGLGFLAGQIADAVVWDSVRWRFIQEMQSRAQPGGDQNSNQTD